ncbi:MAG: hypothetical protein AAGF57_12170 [Pseudomonadota bacterium]
MIDDIVGGVFRFLFGHVKDFIVDVIFGVVFYTVGWLVLKIVSLGRTPAATLREGISDSYDTEDDWVGILGGIILLGIFMKLYF